MTAYRLCPKLHLVTLSVLQLFFLPVQVTLKLSEGCGGRSLNTNTSCSLGARMLAWCKSSCATRHGSQASV